MTLSYDELDAGELAALRLASSESGSFLLIDDAAGRAAAAELGIANTGTLGVLIAASHRQLLDLDEAVARLRATSFRISRALIDRALVENRKGFQIT